MSALHLDGRLLICGCCRDQQIVLRTLDGDRQIGASSSRDPDGFAAAREMLASLTKAGRLIPEPWICFNCQGGFVC